MDGPHGPSHRAGARRRGWTSRVGSGKSYVAARGERHGVARTVHGYGSQRDRVVRTAAARARPPAYTRKAPKTDRTRDGGAVHALAAALATRRAGNAACRRARDSRGASAAPGF